VFFLRGGTAFSAVGDQNFDPWPVARLLVG